MAIKNGEQRIEELSEKIKKLEAQKKQLETRTREQDRKARTRRLIQIGAVIEGMGIDNIVIAEKFRDYFISNSKSKQWLDNFIISEISNDIQEEIKSL